MTTTKLTITQAHKITGASRNTIKKYITDPQSDIRLTAEKNAKGHFLIDASELMRVFGNDLDFDLAAVKKGKNKSAIKRDRLSVTDRDQDMSLVQQQLEREKAQWEREREELVSDKERLHQVITTMQKEHADSMRLLEDQRRGKNWEEKLENLASQVANYQQEIEKERKLNRRYRQALHQERTKPFLERLFATRGGSRGLPRGRTETGK